MFGLASSSSICPEARYRALLSLAHVSQPDVEESYAGKARQGAPFIGDPHGKATL